MILATLPGGEEVHHYKKSIVISFTGGRKVLSTSPHNGGYRENLQAVFNNDCTIGAGMAAKLRAPTYTEHMVLLSRELGLDPETSAGISTAAQMENVSIKTESHNELSVTAIVTGGVEVNGGRVGDAAFWDELEEQKKAQGCVSESDNCTAHGTINIILYIDACLSEDALTRALVTCTEAKTAALQELAAPSRYSHGLATGSGTDGSIIVANADSRLHLTNAGKHSKLGELIGRAVKAAVKEALFLQTGLSPENQHDILKRVDRFGITEDSLWARYSARAKDRMNRAMFSHHMHTLFREDIPLTFVALYVHLLDELDWGLISGTEALVAGEQLLTLAGMRADTAWQSVADTAAAITLMVENLAEGLVHFLETRTEG
jgi:adenosylcobinamide amidohydrolase